MTNLQSILFTIAIKNAEVADLAKKSDELYKQADYYYERVQNEDNTADEEMWKKARELEREVDHIDDVLIPRVLRELVKLEEQKKEALEKR